MTQCFKMGKKKKNFVAGKFTVMMSVQNCRSYISPVSNTNIQQGRGHLSLTLVRLETIFD